MKWNPKQVVWGVAGIVIAGNVLIAAWSFRSRKAETPVPGNTPASPGTVERVQPKSTTPGEIPHTAADRLMAAPSTNVAAMATNTLEIPMTPTPIKVTNEVKTQEIAGITRWQAPTNGPGFAEFEKGLKAAKGDGKSRDMAQAAEWFRQSAAAGNAEGQFNLGLLYVSGQGVEKDYSKAAEWFRRAAEQGHPDAQFNLAVLYIGGLGVPQDDTVAAQWARKAADNGNAEAAYNLGILYTSGRGVPQDAAQAARWFQVAAEGDISAAESNLGVFYIHGKGVPKDDVQAHKWFLKAAQHGNPTAQFNLGVMYAKGQGVEKNLLESYFWSSLAAMQGDDEAGNNRDQVALEMTPKSIADTLKRVTAFAMTNTPSGPTTKTVGP